MRSRFELAGFAGAALISPCDTSAAIEAVLIRCLLVDVDMDSSLPRSPSLPRRRRPAVARLLGGGHLLGGVLKDQAGRLVLPFREESLHRLGLLLPKLAEKPASEPADKTPGAEDF